MELSAVLATGLCAGGVSCSAVQGGLLAGLIARPRWKAQYDQIALVDDLLTEPRHALPSRQAGTVPPPAGEEGTLR